MLPRLEISFDKKDRAVFRRGEREEWQCNQFVLNHCRTGIVLALDVLQLPAGSRVGLMTYNCHTVMNAIWQAQLTPVFIDVTNELTLDVNDLRKKIDGMQALVITHLFGIINDVSAIKKLFPDIVIIEDCAHAYAHAVEGDFGVYSIGQGKFPSVGDGGVLEVKNKKYLDAVAKVYSTITDYTSREESKLYYKLWFRAFINQPLIYKFITLPLKQKRDMGVTPQKESIKRMSIGVNRLLKNKKQDYTHNIQERKRTAESITRKYNITNYELGENAFMLVVHTKTPSALQERFRRNGIDSATHFANSIDWARAFGYKGDCPNSERLTNELLMIPIYKKLYP